MRILLLAGGWSSEREVSLKGAVEVKKALLSLGHEVRQLDPLKDMPEIFAQGRKHDFVFVNMHGAPGEDGLIQAIVERLRLPFNGSDAVASIIALNKFITKIYYREAGLPVCADFLLTWSNRESARPAFAFPMIMKPNTGGSSIRLQRLDNEQELREAIRQKVLSDRDEYILEPLIVGQELTCPVLGNRDDCEALPSVLIKPAGGQIFDFTAKYAAGGAQEICPAPIPEEIEKRIRQLALAAHKVLGLSGYSRTDFMLQADGTLYLLESNTLPGMTTNSLLPKSAAVYGLDFDQLVQRIIDLGLEKFKWAKPCQP